MLRSASRSNSLTVGIRQSFAPHQPIDPVHIGLGVAKGCGHIFLIAMTGSVIGAVRNALQSTIVAGIGAVPGKPIVGIMQALVALYSISGRLLLPDQPGHVVAHTAPVLGEGRQGPALAIQLGEIEPGPTVALDVAGFISTDYGIL
jgi:hypothetical protein